ncbi:MAG: hypothetical protein EOL97_09435 [Spirochaetia bacterium]|nr:hypothetical protein [Spirochaetia bacterium]
MNLALKILYKDYREMSYEEMGLLKKYFRYNNESKLWHGRYSEEAHQFINANKEYISNYSAVIDEILRLLSKSIDIKYWTDTLYEFQRVAIKKGVELYHHEYRGYNLFLDVGLGKTLCSLEIMKSIDQLNQVLILCPKSLMSQWKSEILKFNFASEEQIQVIHGSAVNRQLQWYTNKSYIIATYDTFRRDMKDIEMDFKFLILDECTKLKNASSKIHQALNAYSNRVSYIINLTGTPIENNPGDLFNINKLHDKITYAASFNKFKTQHAIMSDVWSKYTGKNVSIINGWRRIEDYLKLIKPHTYLLHKDDSGIDLPEIIELNKFIDTTKQQDYALRQLMSTLNWDDSIFEIFTLLALLDDGVNTLKSSTSDKVSFLKEKDLTDGGNKIEQLLSDLEEIGNKQVLIFSTYIRSSLDIQEALVKAGYNCKYYRADSSILDEFREGRLQILIAGDNLSYGISFPDVDYLINFSLHPNPAKMIQRKGRIHRVNSKNRKTIINYIGNIIGTRIFNILNEKKEFSDETNIIKEIVNNYRKERI